MGRFYSGDIEGKFWFGSQPSNDAEQFGAIQTEPSYIPYFADNKEVCLQQLYALLMQIGVANQKDRETIVVHHSFINDWTKDESFNSIDIPFIQNYTKEDIGDGCHGNKYDKQLASINLGLKIYWCINDKGACYFDAEL